MFSFRKLRWDFGVGKLPVTTVVSVSIRTTVVSAVSQTVTVVSTVSTIVAGISIVTIIGISGSIGLRLSHNSGDKSESYEQLEKKNTKLERSVFKLFFTEQRICYLAYQRFHDWF